MVLSLAMMPLHQGGEEGDRPGERRSGGVAASGGGQDQGVPGGHDDDNDNDGNDSNDDNDGNVRRG